MYQLFTYLLNLVVEKTYADPPDIAPFTPNSTTGVAPVVAVNTIYDKILEVVMVIAGGLAVLYLIYYGIQYITAGGSPDKAKAARQGVINAIIGIVIIVAAYGIIHFAITLGGTVNNTLVTPTP